jgi:hypothetical protein
VSLINNCSERCDVAYVSKTFNLPLTKIPQLSHMPNADKVYCGGTGFAISLVEGKERYDRAKNPPLPDAVEHIYPDYGLYPTLTTDTAFGFLTRGCPNRCGFCIVSGKEGAQSVEVAELAEFWHGQKNIKLMDANLLACPSRERLINALIASKARIDFTQGLDARFVDEGIARLLCQANIKMVHFAFDLTQNEPEILRGLRIFKKHFHGTDRHCKVYVLTNYNTAPAEDWQRVRMVMELGYRPDVRIYQKGTESRFLTDLARWANNPRFYRSCSFADYVPRKDGKRCGELYRDVLGVRV